MLRRKKKMSSADLCGKLETDIEIKASAKKFHDIFKHKPHHISNVSADKIQGCDIHEGEWGTIGSVIYWNYFHGKISIDSTYRIFYSTGTIFMVRSV